jgi:medium-chain acyl-[acyl-carrier-protein] hydrolase
VSKKELRMTQMNQESLILKTRYKINSTDTDMEARLRLGSLVNLLIQSATSSADSLGFGFEGLQQQKLFWVLSRLTLEIYKPICWHDEVEVETWPKNVDRLIYIRDFVVRDEQDQVVARATSGWLAVDKISKRVKTVDSLHSEVYTQLKNRHSLEQFPAKLDPATEGDHFELRSSYFDIDLNKHVTSSRYIDWMMDTLPVEFHQLNYPKHLSVNYLKETKLGEPILLVRARSGESEFDFEGTNLDLNAASFRGRVGF